MSSPYIIKLLHTFQLALPPLASRHWSSLLVRGAWSKLAVQSEGWSLGMQTARERDRDRERQRLRLGATLEMRVSFSGLLNLMAAA